MSTDTSSSSGWVPIVFFTLACGIGAVSTPILRGTLPYEWAVQSIARSLPHQAQYKNVVLPKVTASLPMGNRISTFSLRAALHVEAQDFKEISKISPVISSHLHEVLSSLRPIDTETPESWEAVIRLIKISVAELVPELDPEQVLILEFVLE